MQIYHALPDKKVLFNTALTIGTFDGVHRGHLEIIKQLRHHAAERQLQSAILTFTDVPQRYLSPDYCPDLLTTPREKIAGIAATGIESLLIVPFDAAFATQEYDVFVRDILVDKLDMRLLLAGPDFAIGKGRRGDLTALQQLSEKLQFDVKVLSQKYFYKEDSVSSTRIRAALEAGNIADANAMLGHRYTFSGAVIRGRGWGHRLGMPTINVAYPERKVLPAEGIYAAWARLDDDKERLPAALSIGTNSSVGGKTISVEFNIIGRHIPPPHMAQVELVAWHRAQEHYDDLDVLVARMQQDVQEIEQILHQSK